MLIIKSILTVLKAVWGSLVLIGTIVGILFLWPDIQELPKIYPRLFGWVPMLERGEIAYIALIPALAWILWMDARPYIQSWWQKRRHPSNFTILGDVYCQTYYVESTSDKKNTGFYANVFYLVVGNALNTGQMLKRVQARIFHLGPPTLCRNKDSESEEIDIRHGEWIYFEIGKLVSKEIMGQVSGGVVVEENQMRAYSHNLPLGALSFEVSSVGKKREYGLAHRPEHPVGWSFFMVISADDVKTARVNISVDMTKTKSPVSCELVA